MLYTLFASIFFAFVGSPLQTTNDYKFTTPIHGWFVQGKLLGTNPQVPCQLRGEDQIYLFEAVTEIDTLRNAPGTTFSKIDGIDPITPSKFVRGIGNRGVRPFSDIYNIVESRTLYKKDASIDGNPTNLLLHRSTGIQIYNYAVDSLASSEAYPTNNPANVNLGYMAPGITNVRAMVATNVACFYKTLKTVRGFGKDYAAQNSSTPHVSSGNWYYTDCYFDYSTGTYTYQRHTEHPQYINTGGGYRYYVNSANRMTQRQYNGNDVLSQAMPSDEEAEYYYNDPLTCILFTNAFARASQLTAIKSWLVCRGNCQDYFSIWQNPTTIKDVISYYTNATIVVECSASFTETNGMVMAEITPNYELAFNRLFSSGGVPSSHIPIMKSVPPPENAFAPGESITKENASSMNVYILPRNVALIIGVDWHTGFQNVE